MARAKELQAAGRAALEEKTRSDPNLLLVSDASNSPFNEGHFAIRSGQLLPLPKRSFPITGKHYVLSITDGSISFPLVDTNDPDSVRSASEGFFVSKIVHDGAPIRLLDIVPGTGVPSISNYRGHIGQIFMENDYSPKNSPRRALIHNKLMSYLRDPLAYSMVVKSIASGHAVFFKRQGLLIRFKQNPYNHTYWIESEGGRLFILKTYPNKEFGKPAGVTFNDGPDLLFEVAGTYSFKINNAFIGTNGRDVRVVIPKDGEPEPIRTLENYPNLTLGDGKYFDRPLANFIAFSEV